MTSRVRTQEITDLAGTGSPVIPNGIAITTTSTTTPGIRKSDDTNTGLHWSAADQLDLVTGGSPRFRIESTGQIKAVYESTTGTDYNTTLHNGYLCRAWVNFNGTGTVAIRASGNVSSITDNTTGDYTVNFTTAMPDVNFCANITTDNSASAYPIKGTVTTYAVGSIRIIGERDTSGNNIDSTFVNVAVFR